MRQRAAFATMSVLLTMLVTGCGSSGYSANNSSAAAGRSDTSAASAAPGRSPYSAPANSSPAPSATPAALISTKHDKLGTILAYGPRRLTVYLFEADRGTTSSCTGQCAQVWPAVTGMPRGQAGARSSELGTTTRAGGVRQVTYKGHPLYLYAKDKDNKDVYGQGITSFGAAWYALRPSGDKADLS